jgi:putative transposase
MLMLDGFRYLCATMDWYSRMILSWSISNTMSVDFCVNVMEEALGRYPKPYIFNTDQGSQFPSKVFTKILKDNEIKLSIDGKYRAIDNVFIEKFWRDIKYNCIYLHTFETGSALYQGIAEYIFTHDHRQNIQVWIINFWLIFISGNYF